MQYKDVTAKPTPPPMAHRLSPAVDLYNKPVAVPANTVFASSSSPRANCSSTPNAEYITVMQPSVFAVAEPCFIKWFKSLREIERKKIILSKWNDERGDAKRSIQLTEFVAVSPLDLQLVLQQFHYTVQLFRPNRHQPKKIMSKKNQFEIMLDFIWK